MNPIDFSTSSKQNPEGKSATESGLGLFSRPAEEPSHAFFAPLHYEPGYAYPLLVWLHGSGHDDERQLIRVMPLISMRNYAAAAPRGFPLSAGRGEPLGWPQTAEAIAAAGERIFDCIGAARERFHVAPRRIFLGGFDSGGTMAFRIALRHPESFAGVLSLGGPFPDGHQPFVQLRPARSLPVFLALGRDSHVYSPEQACRDLRLLHTAGISVTLRQYPCGHQLSEQMLRDVDRWIMEQITTSTAHTPSAAG